jgi:hypothetical protein
MIGFTRLGNELLVGLAIQPGPVDFLLRPQHCNTVAGEVEPDGIECRFSAFCICNRNGPAFSFRLPFNCIAVRP